MSKATSETLGHGTCGCVCGELGAVPELHGDLLTGLLQLHNVPCCLPLALPPITCTHTANTQQLPWRQGQGKTVTAGTSKDVNSNTRRHGTSFFCPLVILRNNTCKPMKKTDVFTGQQLRHFLQNVLVSHNN